MRSHIMHCMMLYSLSLGLLLVELGAHMLIHFRIEEFMLH
jgi:hypothetical protein